MVQEECPLDCNLLSIILHSFLFMNFSLRVSRIKVSNEAISIQEYMSYLVFLPTGGFFEEDIQDILKMCIALKILKEFCFERWSNMPYHFRLIVSTRF